MTLSEIIDTLSLLPRTLPFEGVELNGDSYRGDYCEFALEPSGIESTTTVGGLLNYLEGKVLGMTFEGYKGGEYTMYMDTEVYIAPSGCTGYATKAIVLSPISAYFLLQEYS